MSTMNLTVKDNVHVLSLINNEHENRFNQDVLEEYLAALDKVEAYQGNTALMITCEHEKTFSTGIDLEWLMAQSAEGQALFVKTLETVLYRLALLSAPSLIAINGNAYAGGAILSCASDFRVMRSDRGRFCFPEVNIKIPFTPLMSDIVDLLPNKHALKHMMLTGRPYTGIECEQFNIVDSIHAEDELQTQAFEFCRALAEKDRATYTTIRNTIRPNISRHGKALGLS